MVNSGSIVNTKRMLTKCISDVFPIVDWVSSQSAVTTTSGATIATFYTDRDQNFDCEIYLYRAEGTIVSENPAPLEITINTGKSHTNYTISNYSGTFLYNPYPPIQILKDDYIRINVNKLTTTNTSGVYTNARLIMGY